MLLAVTTSPRFFTSILIFFLALFLAKSAFASKEINGVISSPLHLYASPHAIKPAKDIAVPALPIPIQEEKAGFYRIRINDQEFWVDGMHVRVKRNANARCTVTGNTSYQPTGSTAGAGRDLCK